MDCFVKKDAYVGEASINIEGIAMADPMRVCGRVKRHKTIGNAGGLVSEGVGSSLVDVTPLIESTPLPLTPFDGEIREDALASPLIASLLTNSLCDVSPFTLFCKGASPHNLTFLQHL